MISLDTQTALLNKLSKGLPICEFPYLELANELEIEESTVLDFISDSILQNRIKRIGMVLNHHKLGYTANAMVVWDIPDAQVDQVGNLLGQQEKITLCYQRTRQLPSWRYNLFTMIHGKDKQQVLAQLEKIIDSNNLNGFCKDVLFSTNQFKQMGANYD